ncbi:MAG: ABC transporter substrate-binding protein [Thermoanaerobaculia bacterium]
MRRIVIIALALALCSCGRSESGTQITISGSAVGKEADLLRTQIARFERLHRGIHVEIQPTPDDATQRHQLFVQWLNARVGRPDVLQLDIVWTPEFAAAGWILPLDRFRPESGDFFPATLTANRWRGTLYAVPWFVDVGMIYRRTDLIPSVPESLDALAAAARGAQSASVPCGIGWEGARYEGLVTVFVEYLGAFGGTILDDDGNVTVDSPAGIRALEFMRDEITRWHIAPEEVLTWHEEEARFAFQNGRCAMMRNWPYAWSLLSDREKSSVAGRFAVMPLPAAPGGHATSALGGSELAINSASPHPDAAWTLVSYLTAPEQMLERASVVGQIPARRSLFSDPRLREALGPSPEMLLPVVDAAVPRPVTPIYSQLSDVLQIHLHRALSGQSRPGDALRAAAAKMRQIIRRSGLASADPPGGHVSSAVSEVR